MVLGICGKSGSGKDTLIKMIKDRNRDVYRMVKASDRPPRKYEKNGQDYWYFTKEDFKEAERTGSFITVQSFKVANGETWDYGIFQNDIEECLDSDCLCLITLTPYEVEALYKKLNKNQLDRLYILYLNITDDIRRKRLLERGDDIAEINRRIDADNADFDNPIFLSMVDDMISASETNIIYEEIQDDIDMGIGFFNEFKRG